MEGLKPGASAIIRADGPAPAPAAPAAKS